MSVTSERVDSIKNTLSQKENPAQNIQDNLTSSIKDPFGQIINNTFFKVNSLVSNIEKKIDQLLEDVSEYTDSRARVVYENSKLVVTVTREDIEQAEQIKNRVESKINSIRNTLSMLESSLNSVQAVQTAMTTLQTVLNIQETILSLNPTTAPIYTVFKKAIKIVFFKDILNEYGNILKKQLKQNLNVLESLSERFKQITVDVKIAEERDMGYNITKEEAEKILINDLLAVDQQAESGSVEKVTEYYTSSKNKKYILVVEKYTEKTIIGKAYEDQSGMLEQQTAPTYIRKPEDLIEELKQILNI